VRSIGLTAPSSLPDEGTEQRTETHTQIPTAEMGDLSPVVSPPLNTGSSNYFTDVENVQVHAYTDPSDDDMN